MILYRFYRSLLKAMSSLLELIYPSLCPICQCRLSATSEEGLCPYCSISLKHYEPLIYRAEERLYASPLFRQLYGLYAYEKSGTVQLLIHAFKYGGYASLARPIGRSALYRFRWNRCDYAYIIAVPIEPYRLTSRGYNQALLIAKEIAQCLGIPATDSLLKRRVGSHTQTKLGKQERMENMKSAFVLAPEAKSKLSAQRILLVDDVLTTGSTLVEVCNLLEQAGVASVDVFVIAVAI